MTPEQKEELNEYLSGRDEWQFLKRAYKRAGWIKAGMWTAVGTAAGAGFLPLLDVF